MLLCVNTECGDIVISYWSYAVLQFGPIIADHFADTRYDFKIIKLKILKFLTNGIQAGPKEVTTSCIFTHVDYQT